MTSASLAVKKRQTKLGLRNNISDLKETYKGSLTIHGLSRILTGNRHAKCFWLACFLSVLAFAFYMCSVYCATFWNHEIHRKVRTERVKEMPLPAISICPQTTERICYHGKPIHVDGFHRKTKCLSTKILQDDFGEATTAHIGNRCIILNKRGNIKQKHSILPVKFRITSDTEEINIAMDEPHTTADLKAMLPMFSKSIIQGEHVISLQMVKQKRLPPPFPSNCSTGEGIENLFSSKYSKRACIQSCFVREMLQNCGDVIDDWKLLLTDLNYNKTNDTMMKICVKEMFLKMIQKREPESCHCPLPCVETTYELVMMQVPQAKRKCPCHSNSKCSCFDVIFQYTTNKIKYIEEVPNYTLSNLVADIGSIIGTLAGTSVISIFELLVFLVVCIAGYTL